MTALSSARLPPLFSGFPPDQRNGDKEFVIRRAATNRVLNVLRHWVSKHSQVWLLCSHPVLPGPAGLATANLSFPLSIRLPA